LLTKPLALEVVMQHHVPRRHIVSYVQAASFCTPYIPRVPRYDCVRIQKTFSFAGLTRTPVTRSPWAAYFMRYAALPFLVWLHLQHK